MPNTSQDVINYWRERVEIDYFTQFIKAYIVFNAWYRKRFGDGSERSVIDSVKNEINQNPVRSAIVGKFTSVAPEADEFRALVGALHRSLTNYALTNTKGHSVTFTQVFVAYNNRRTYHHKHNGIDFYINASTATAIVVKVTSSTNHPMIDLTQTEYDWEGVKADAGFNLLSGTQVAYLQNYYAKAHPIITEDLTNTGGRAPILCGDSALCDNPAYLFSGLVEIIYDLRNLLFHGEIIPSVETSAIYQAAYSILLKFIKAIP